MDLKIRWLAPFDLCDGSKSGLIYAVTQFEDIPDSPGVYVFSRVHGNSVSPLYVGKAENLQRRIGQQMKGNVRLMRAIENAPVGYRRLHVAEFDGKGGQSAKKALGIIEAALISAALVEGYSLVNIQGKKTIVHTIESGGNREARTWLPENTIQVRKS